MATGRTADQCSVDEIAAQVDDEALVRQTLADPECFAVLYDRYVDLVYRYCFRRLGTVAAAEDATSTTFFNALTGLPSFDPGIKPFRSWLFGITHNAVIDQLRIRQRRKEDGFETVDRLVDHLPQPEDQAIARDEHERLERAVGTLTVDQQQVVELRLAGLSGQEIATRLGRKPGAIRATQHRALQRLRAMLNPASQTSPGDEGEGHD